MCASGSESLPKIAQQPTSDTAISTELFLEYGQHSVVSLLAKKNNNNKK
jgi:hypothetical protein